ncbi:hydroxymethylpyrimidine/phosphomethylpyrimidine kinase [uncultured Tenacibaculum sp.]|uniref:hydroxymethylpyrimidine/phosphomethylpyrimidine kinase n=1 Tax=uncultured Tenacibaculum sp. TaxID=174713 RepID=UPI00262EAE29|nr:hydroxymethylpyrimidine/phosphomethylpyrimidine kinase [uncultured Tenacibaculum sp.]
MKQQAYILTIAGFDPSSGAGLTSDIKTFEAHGLYGLSVCTAVTVQNDIDFKDCVWIDKETIINQVETLFERFEISVAKIGIIQSWSVLLEVVQILKKCTPSIKIVLDPVLKASAGFDFHLEENIKVFEEVLQHCDFITPNYEEIKAFFSNKSIEETIEFISEKTNIYLKGGHREDKKGWDEVYHSKIVQLNIPPKATSVFEKHGSGCVLSSALASNIAKQLPLEDACLHAKWYTEQFLNSNETLLGEHNYK